MESKSRTFYKIVIWRILTLTVTITVLQVYMQDFYVASSIGVIDHSICLVLHYFYERFWGHVTWGIIPDTPSIEQNDEIDIQTSVV